MLAVPPEEYNRWRARRERASQLRREEFGHYLFSAWELEDARKAARRQARRRWLLQRLHAL